MPEIWIGEDHTIEPPCADWVNTRTVSGSATLANENIFQRGKMFTSILASKLSVVYRNRVDCDEILGRRIRRWKDQLPLRPNPNNYLEPFSGSGGRAALGLATIGLQRQRRLSWDDRRLLLR